MGVSKKLCFLLLMILLTPILAAAQPSDLLISEYVEGSSNNKALELYNGTGSAIDLASDNYVLQFYFNGSTSAGLTITLTGTVADGAVFVVAHSGAVTGILDEADQTNGAGWYNGDDAIVLRKGGTSGTVVDAIGRIGEDPGSQWGSGDESTQDNTLRRKSDACTGDTDPTDAFDPSADFDGYAQNNIDDLGSHTAICSGGGETAPSVATTSPADNAAGVAEDANIVITFSEAVDVTGSWFTLETSGGTPVSASVSGGAAEYTLDPVADLTQGETYTVTVHSANVTDQDGDDPPDNMEADYSFSFTVESVVLISTIQGYGLTSPLDGQVVTIEGIVVGDFQEGDGDYSDLDGFFVQEEDADQDGDPATSEGIFVYASGAVDVQPGDVVRVTGRVDEYETSGGASSLTELTSVSSVSVTGSAALPSPAELEFPFPSLVYPEHFEGMLVRFPQELVIAEYYNFDRFNEVVLAWPLNNVDRPFQPTSYREPGTAANNVAEKIALRRITLDDARTSSNPNPALHPNGQIFDLDNRFRGGDIVRNATGVIDDRYGLYRIQPTQGADYTAENPRQETPEEVGGCLKVASFNVLNYFLTIDNGSDICGPGADVECRGADTEAEFQRQRTKILSALAAIEADIFGLIEMENTTGVEPLEDIVGGLNDLLGDGAYDYIVTGTIGTDAIKVGIIYKPGTVTPVGAYQTLTSAVDSRFVDTKNRPSLAQTFRENSSGEVLTVVVNHFKSKGSDCEDLGDPDMGDGAGNCNETRTLAAQALVDWLATDPTGSEDPDFLIIGDLNSYDKEDPIDAVKAGADDVEGTDDDFVDLSRKFNGQFAYSYVFDGQLGYLDYALATRSLRKRVTGVTEWHINADEPDLLDYDMSFKGAAQEALFEENPFRSSDHDPVIVGLDLSAPALSVGASPLKLWPPNGSYHTVSLDDLDIEVSDNCNGDLSAEDVVIAKVWTDEPETGINFGNTTDDMIIAADCRSVQLRAERAGNRNGRIYRIVLKVDDGNGNTSRETYTVKVPIFYKGSAENDGQVYSVEGCEPDAGLARAVAGNTMLNEKTIVASESGTFISVKGYPGNVNPNKVEVALSAPGTVDLVVYDASGSEVMRVLSANPMDAGTHYVPVDFSNLPGGAYILHLGTGDAVAHHQLVIVR